MKKMLTTIIAASMIMSAVPVMQASAESPSPTRTVRWDETTLTDSAMTLNYSSTDNSTLENFAYDKADFVTASKGKTESGARINTAKPVTGLFGKAADDVAVNMHTDNAKANAQGSNDNKEVYSPRYMFTNHATGNNYNIIARPKNPGGYERISFDLALSESVKEAYFQAQNPDASNRKDIFKTTRTGFSFMGGNTISYDKPLQSDKWYHIELVLRNGTADSETAHKGWVYIDGKKLAEADFTWADNNNNAKKIERLNEYFLGFTGSGNGSSSVFLERDAYFDNMKLEYWNAALTEAEAPVRTGNVDLSTNNTALEERNVNGVYAGIASTITVADYKASLKNQNLAVVVRDSEGNEVADSESLAGEGNYIVLTDTDGVTYYKKAFTSRNIMSTDFDDQRLSLSGAPAGGIWNTINQYNTEAYPALTTAVRASIGGKSVDDYAYAVNIDDYVGAADSSSKFFGFSPVNPMTSAYAGNHIVVENSIYIADSNINRTYSINTTEGTSIQFVMSASTDEQVMKRVRIGRADTGTYNKDVFNLTANCWHKFAVVFTPGSKNITVFVDDQRLDFTDILKNGFDSVSRVRFTTGVNQGTDAVPVNSHTYIDDFRVIETPENYAPDMSGLTSEEYIVNNQDRTIMISGEAVAREEFDSKITVSGTFTIYDDENMNSSSMSQMVVSPGMVVAVKNRSGMVLLYTVVSTPTYASNTFDEADNDNSLTNSAPNGEGWGAMKLNNAAYPGHSAEIVKAGYGKAENNSAYRLRTENFVGNQNESNDNLFDPFYHYCVNSEGFENGVFVYATDLMLSDTESIRQFEFSTKDASNNAQGFTLRIANGSNVIKLSSSTGQELASAVITLDRWHRIAVAIPSGTNTASLYIDGQRIADNVAVTTLEGGIQNITRVKVSIDFGSRTEENAAYGMTSYDNISFYQNFEGYTEKAPAVTGNMVNDKSITPASPQMTIKSLIEGLTFSENTVRRAVYTDSTFSKQATDNDIITGREILVAESNDGIIEYYTISGQCSYGEINLTKNDTSAEASLNVSNYSNDSATGIIILCEYSGDTLKNVVMQNFNIDSGVDQEISIDMTGISAGSRVEAFVWNSLDDMVPLTPSVSK